MWFHHRVFVELPRAVSLIYSDWLVLSQLVFTGCRQNCVLELCSLFRRLPWLAITELLLTIKALILESPRWCLAYYLELEAPRDCLNSSPYLMHSIWHSLARISNQSKPRRWAWWMPQWNHSVGWSSNLSSIKLPWLLAESFEANCSIPFQLSRVA